MKRLYIFLLILSSCQVSKNNQVSVTSENSEDHSQNNQSKVIFEGKNNKVKQHNKNSKDLSQNNQTVVIVKGDNNDIAMNNTNVSDVSHDRKDTIIIEGNNQTVVVEDKDQIATNADGNSTITVNLEQLSSHVNTVDPSTLNGQTSCQVGKYYYKQYLSDSLYSNDGQRNFNLAYIFLYKSANEGNSEAQNLLGEIYYYGYGDKPLDEDYALYWYKQAGKEGTSAFVVPDSTMAKIRYEKRMYDLLNTPASQLNAVDRKDLTNHLYAELLKEVNASQYLIYQNTRLEKQCYVTYIMLKNTSTATAESQYKLGSSVYHWYFCMGTTMQEGKDLLNKSAAQGYEPAIELLQQIEQNGE